MVLHKLRIVLVASILPLPAASAVESASAVDPPEFGFDVSAQWRP
jgi:hypothetical protein